MKRDVKKLIREARFEPVSKDLDDRMEKLFSSSANALHPKTGEIRKRDIRFGFVWAGLAAGLILIIGLNWQIRENLTEVSHRSPGDGTDEYKASVTAAKRLTVDGASAVFTSENVVFRRMFTAVGTNQGTILKGQFRMPGKEGM